VADVSVFFLCLIRKSICIDLEKTVACCTGGPYGQGVGVIRLVKDVGDLESESL
jgi:hypothetical protein